MDAIFEKEPPGGRCTTVLVVDDHPVLRNSLAQIIRGWNPRSVVHEAGSVASAVAACAETAFDLVLLDLGLPDQSGMVALSHLRAFHQRTAVAVISEHEQPAIATQCLTMGAVAFVSKSAPYYLFEQELLRLLQHGHAAGALPASRSRVAEPDLGHHFEGLTPRQAQVMQWLVKGYSNKRIARELGLLPDTVKLHVSGIMKKVQVHSRGEVIARFATLMGTGWSGNHRDAPGSRHVSAAEAAPSRTQR